MSCSRKKVINGTKVYYALLLPLPLLYPAMNAKYNSETTKLAASQTMVTTTVCYYLTQWQTVEKQLLPHTLYLPSKATYKYKCFGGGQIERVRSIFRKKIWIQTTRSIFSFHTSPQIKNVLTLGLVHTDIKFPIFPPPSSVISNLQFYIHSTRKHVVEEGQGEEVCHQCHLRE